MESADRRPGRGHDRPVRRPRPSRPASGAPGDGAAGEADLRDTAQGQRSIWPHVEEKVLDLIEAHRSTIVFANSRRLAERLCGRLMSSPRNGRRPATRPPRAWTRPGRPPAGPGRPRSWRSPAPRRCPGRGGPRASWLGVPAGAGADRGGAEGGAAARRGGHVQPGTRHRHGRGGPGHPGGVARRRWRAECSAPAGPGTGWATCPAA